jgi:hypothetical protein
MALGAITFIRKLAPRRGVRIRICLLVGEASYTTGGVAVTPANFLLNAIDGIFFSAPFPLVDRVYIFDKANSKIMAQVGSTGAQVAGAVSCAADQIILTVYGR